MNFKWWGVLISVVVMFFAVTGLVLLLKGLAIDAVVCMMCAVSGEVFLLAHEIRATKTIHIKIQSNLFLDEKGALKAIHRCQQRG